MDNINLRNLSLIKTNEAIAAKSIKPFTTTLVKVKFNKYDFEFRSIVGKRIFYNNYFGPQQNPFLPWDQKLEVSLVGDSHVLILNKFPVELGHLLLITKEWKPQNGWIEQSDWNAFVKIEKNITGFWFFNNSELSGASQPHRHIQLLPRTNQENLFPTQKMYSCKTNHINSPSHII